MLEKILEKFVVRCKAKSLAKPTIFQYQNGIRHLDKYLEENNIKEITTVVIEDYMAERALGLARSSMRNEYISLRTFFDYAVKRGFVKENPCDGLDKPKQGKHAVRVFSDEEIQKILSCCNRDTFVGLRNYVLIELLLGTGMRISEACGIRFEDIDLGNNWIVVHGKGDKDRFLPLTNKLRKELGLYLKARKRYLTEKLLPITEYVFVSRTGKKLLKDEVGNTFLEIKKKVGGKGARFSPHTFRHTFATMWLKNGGDLFTLQKLLGHSSITTTRIYVNLSQSDLQNQMLKFNPLENEKWKFT